MIESVVLIEGQNVDQETLGISLASFCMLRQTLLLTLRTPCSNLRRFQASREY
jgi:hypothetical protein